MKSSFQLNAHLDNRLALNIILVITWRFIDMARIYRVGLMCWNYFAAIGAFIWLAILLLPWRPWSTRESLDSSGGFSGSSFE